MKVTQYINRRGNAVRNHFCIFGDDGFVYFQSYDTLVAKYRDQEVVLLKNALDFSATTTKYLAEFLGFEDSKEMRTTLKRFPKDYNFVDEL